VSWQSTAGTKWRDLSFGRNALAWKIPIARDTWTWRALKSAAMVLYCIAIFLALDFTISTLAPGFLFTMQRTPGGKTLRKPDPVFHHTLAPLFDGVDRWGELPYRVFTNNLGLKDATTREVPAKSDARRILLIGDSFTEGIGLEFQDTFAGMLYRAGQQRTPKIEFLNAGVVSYSPTIYYDKIKYLLDSGLQIDEVVVLPDLSDIQDEALFYFCFDSIPEYRAHCISPDRDSRWLANSVADFWQTHFVMVDRLRVMLKRRLQQRTNNLREVALTPNTRTGWIIPGYPVGEDYARLGIDGGIERAQRHMQALADLLASRNIPLTLAVYPWPMILEGNMRDNRHVRLWRDFCEKAKCKDFIDLTPDVFAAKDTHPDWYSRYFIFGDVHYSAEGHRLLFQTLQKHLLPGP
jgi:hypothetical protein